VWTAGALIKARESKANQMMTRVMRLMLSQLIETLKAWVPRGWAQGLKIRPKFDGFGGDWFLKSSTVYVKFSTVHPTFGEKIKINQVQFFSTRQNFKHWLGHDHSSRVSNFIEHV
jgi:hypothetical protein